MILVPKSKLERLEQIFEEQDKGLFGLLMNSQTTKEDYELLKLSYLEHLNRLTDVAERNERNRATIEGLLNLNREGRTIFEDIRGSN